MLQRISLADTVALSVGERLSVSGFADDTIVTEALQRPRGASQASSRAGRSRSRRRSPSPPGSAAAAPTRPPRCCSRTTSCRSRSPRDGSASSRRRSAPTCRSSSAAGRSSARATAPFSPRRRCRPTTGSCWSFRRARSRPRPATSTAPSTTRDGADGFAERRDALLAALAAVRRPQDLARLPPNDLASSPVSERLREAGAFRADVSGAGPCVYGLFVEPRAGRSSGRALRAEGQTWVVTPVRQADATGPAVSTVGA